MPGCCAVGCSNSRAKGFKVFRLPCGKNDQERRNVWIARIKRENFRPTTYTVLCEVHFESDQFESSVPGKLKPNAVPSLFSHLSHQKHRKPPKKRSKNLSPIKTVPLDHSYMRAGQDVSAIENLQLSETDELQIPNDISDAISQPTDSTQPSALEEIQYLRIQLESTKRKLCKVKKEKDELAQKFNKLFNPDQICFLEQSSDNSSIRWSDETVKKALQLRFACGFNGYNLLLSQGFPLPSARTLRRKLQHISFKHGLITEVFSMMALKVKNFN